MMSLLINPLHLIFDFEYAPYSGKKTGERTLLMKLLERFKATAGNCFLFLLDAGLYSAAMLWQIKQKGQDFIIKVPSHVKFKAIKYLPDGSYIALLNHKILDLDAKPRRDGKKSWQKVSITVRVIEFEIPGFRRVRLVTTVLDETITAREIALHYHSRWDIEIAYDEIKTHQTATLRGQLPTVLRSKRPDLVRQELYAILIMYNVVRLLIHQAALKHNKESLLISFSDVLEHIIEASPNMTAQSQEEQKEGFAYLLELIADCEIDRPRRPRVNPRVVKVKMSSFARKNKKHKSEKRNLADELTIIFPNGKSKKIIIETSREEFNKTKQKRPPKYKPEKIILRMAA